jgi:hypothetical protein
MKKISKTTWNRYKESAESKEVFALFEKIKSPESTAEEILEIAKRFNPQYFRNTSKKEMTQLTDSLNFFLSDLEQILSNEEIKLEEGKDFVNFYFNYLDSFAVDEEGKPVEEIQQSYYKRILGNNILMSTALYAYLPGFFIPNFFVMQFAYLKKFAEKYEIDLPKIPNRSDYRERCLYYLDLCIAIVNFAIENGIEDSAEICTFIYGCELPVIKDEYEAEFDKPMPKVPEQAWILVGNYGEGEKNMKHGFWQANELTSKGDIMLFYEKSPVKKLNSVWIAMEDGVKDPFFHYYSHTYIGNKIEIPADKALTFEDFKNSEYFKKENRGSEGNFVSKNFQDVSGWTVTSEDYAEIKRMLAAKGFDTSVLPALYEPKIMANVNIELEADVSTQLLIPRLEEMGWKKNKDFFAEVEFPAGRGTTGHEMDKRPDFCLHLSGGERDKEAQVVIEVKLNMKNNQEIKANYDQGVSYAKWGNARVLVICDKNQIRVYERNKKNQFVPFDTPTARFRWEDMQQLDKFNELKQLLNKK